MGDDLDRACEGRDGLGSLQQRRLFQCRRRSFELATHVVLPRSLRQELTGIDPLQPPIAQLPRRGDESRIVLCFRARGLLLRLFLRFLVCNRFALFGNVE